MNTATTPLHPTPAPRAAGLWLPAFSLAQRELVRFFRQRNRVIGAIASPLVIWALLGSGLNDAFTLAPINPTTSQTSPDQTVGYLQYFFPGIVMLSLLFTAIFSTISVIEDRKEGFLQAVLVAPIPRLAIVTGKILGGAAIATIQGIFFLILWPLVGPWPGIVAIAATIPVMFLLAAGMTALSFCFAWRTDSTAGFHVIMNLVLMPLWILSGAMFPISTAKLWVKVLMWLNPLTYGHTAFTALITGHRINPSGIPVWVAVLAIAIFTVTAAMLARRIVDQPRKDGSA